MRKLTIFVFSLAVVSFLPFLVAAQTAPGLPASFYGTVTFNGVPLPSGTTIKAYYGASTLTSGQITTTAAGIYGAVDPDNYNGWTDIPLTVNEGTGTIYFKILVSGYNNEKEIVANETSTYSAITRRLDLTFAVPAKPAATPAGGEYHSSQSVSLSATGSPSIYYTLDGSAPDNTKNLYSAAIAIDSSKTLKAIAYNTAGNESQVLSETYTLTCNPDNLAHASTWGAYPGCAITACVSGYTLSSGQCVASACSPSSVANGTVSAFPECQIICNSGYYRSGTSCVASGGGGVGGGGGTFQGDHTAPSIMDVTITKTSTSATISWKTTESSWTWFVWGTTASYGQEKKTEAYALTHSVTLSDLNPSTTYYFQIKTKDAAGNTLYGSALSFTTSAAGSNTSITETPSQSSGGQSNTNSFTLNKPLSQMSRDELLNTLLMLVLQLLLQGKLQL